MLIPNILHIKLFQPKNSQVPLIEGPGAEIKPTPTSANSATEPSVSASASSGQYEESVRAHTVRRGGGVLLLGYHEVPDQTKDRIAPAHQIADKSTPVIPPASVIGTQVFLLVNASVLYGICKFGVRAT